MALILSINCLGVIYTNIKISTRRMTWQKLREKKVNAHTTLELQRISRRKLYNLAPGVIPFHSNDLSRVVHPNASHRWHREHRIAKRPEPVRRNRHAAALRLPVTAHKSELRVCLKKGQPGKQRTVLVGTSRLRSSRSLQIMATPHRTPMVWGHGLKIAGARLCVCLSRREGRS